MDRNSLLSLPFKTSSPPLNWSSIDCCQWEDSILVSLWLQLCWTFRSLNHAAVGVVVNILYYKDTGRSRGFGFVDFSKEDDARCAKEAIDGKALLGQPLRISFALEKVRGGPMVVPCLSNIGDVTSRNT
ncbi:Glycine-rich RNA-binding protein 4, mitochondrial [Morella rubra]|uniref:Glycine-rich RNA-binding protein 4, mitochondrial n=1 Tax=Morella rubra TaxID=262757 RepID=A0A6A1V9P0_9ROSI|nr:Glycine-rich RNA-binding protein 4, mitochondrial [Morella rubra]